MKTTRLSPDEINDALRAQVDLEIPRPIGGFGSADAEDEFRAGHDARFMQLVHNPALWNSHI